MVDIRVEYPNDVAEISSALAGLTSGCGGRDPAVRVVLRPYADQGIR